MSNSKNKAKAFFGSEGFSGATLAAAVISAVLVLNVVIYILVTSLGLVFGPKQREDLGISGSTDKIFADAIAENKKVKISFCMTEDSMKTHDVGSFVYETAMEFKERYPDFIELEFINIIQKRDSKGNLVDLSKFEKDMQGNPNQLSRGSVIFECGHNYRVVTDSYSQAGFADFFTLDAAGNAVAYNGEETFAASIAWVLADEHKKAYLTVGHSEQLDSSFGKLLVAAGYYVDTIDLRKESAVPADAGLVIISNPRSDFEMAAPGSGIYGEIDKLELYLRDGGNLFVTLDPYVRKLTSLEGFLEKCGMSLSESEIENNVYRDIVRDSVNAITTDGYTILANHAEGSVSSAIEENIKAHSGDGKVIIREACALNLTGSAKPLLVSTSSAVCETAGVVTRKDGSFAIAAYNELTVAEGDTPAKIVLIPSIYMTVSDALVTNGYTNKDFLFSIFDKIYGNEVKMPYGCTAVKYDTTILEGLTMSRAKLLTLCAMLLPAALAVTGTVVMIRRKNR